MTGNNPFWMQLRACAHAVVAATVLVMLSVSSADAEERELSFYNIHTKETLTVVYKRDGKYIPEGMKKLNHMMRDWRRDEPTKMDPELIDLVWSIYNELGSQKPIHLISGYRSRKTNEALRRRGGGQARRSLHTLGKAADIHFPDVPVKILRNSALIRERGGVGYYPKSGIPFVHVDTGRVRHWPRLPKLELAALFPNGSKHRGIGNARVTKRDHKRGIKKYGDPRKKILAMAEKNRKAVSRTFAVASAADVSSPSTETDDAKPVAASASGRVDVDMKAPSAKPKRRMMMAGFFPGNPAADAKRPLNDERLSTDGRPWQTFADLFSAGPADATNPGSAMAVRTASLDPMATASIPSDRTPSEPVVQRAAIGGTFEMDDEHPEELSYQPYAATGKMLSDAPLSRTTEIAGLAHPDQAKFYQLSAERDRMRPLGFSTELTAPVIATAQFSGPAIVNLLPESRRTAELPRGKDRERPFRTASR